MPNNVINIIHADKEVLDALKGKNGDVDFSSIIPMPDTVFRGDLGIKERQEHGTNNWRDWSVNNWGTKWNAYGEEGRIDDEVVKFDTAWSHPLPVIKALSRKFPDKLLHVEYADEDLGVNFGSYNMKNGEVIENFAPLDEGTIEARDFACEIVYGMTYDELQQEWGN